MNRKASPRAPISWPAAVLLCGSALLVFVDAIICLAPAVRSQADTAFGDMEKGLVRPDEVQDQACCDRGIYSKSFDKWVRAYLNGNTAEADKSWAGVLQAAKGASNLHRLASSTFARLEFLEGADGEKLEKMGGPIHAVISMYHSSEKAMGYTENLSSIADYICNQFRNSSRFKEAVEWQKKALEIREKVWGKTDLRIWASLNSLGDCEILTHDYASAKSHLDRALTIANLRHDARAAYQTRVIAFRLERAMKSKATR